MKYIFGIIILSVLLTGFEINDKIRVNIKNITLQPNETLVYQSYLGPKVPLKNNPNYSGVNIKANNTGKIRISLNNLKSNAEIVVEGKANWINNKTLLLENNNEISIFNIPYDGKNIIEMSINLEKQLERKSNFDKFIEVDEFCGTTLFPKKRTIPDILLERYRVPISFDEKVIIPDPRKRNVKYTKVAYQGVGSDAHSDLLYFNRPNNWVNFSLHENENQFTYHWGIPFESKDLFIFSKNHKTEAIQITSTENERNISAVNPVEIPIKVWIINNLVINRRAESFISEYLTGDVTPLKIVQHDILRANEIFESSRIGVRLIYEPHYIENVDNNFRLDSNNLFDANAINVVYINQYQERIIGGITFCLDADTNCENSHFKNNCLVTALANNETLMHEIGHIFGLNDEFRISGNANIMKDGETERTNFSQGQAFRMNFYEYSFLNNIRVNNGLSYKITPLQWGENYHAQNNFHPTICYPSDCLEID